MKKYRPGEQAPKTGYYTAFDSDGQNGGEAYLERGQRFPATQNKGSFYILGEDKQ